MTLPSGLYDQIITDSLGEKIGDPALVAKIMALNPDVAAETLAKHVHLATRRALSAVKGDNKLVKQLALVNEILTQLASHENERPMKIVWDLQYPVPSGWFSRVKLAAG